MDGSHTWLNLRMLGYARSECCIRLIMKDIVENVILISKSYFPWSQDG